MSFGYSAYPQQSFGYSGFPAAYPTQFAQAAPAASSASAHEGSQAGDAHAASHSVSGFAGQPIDAGFGGFYGQPTYIGGAAPQFIGAPFEQHHTVLPAAYGQTTFLPQQQLVPVMAPQIRRPGYNERLVAWRNRQKAFNRYKRQTKEAIKSSNHHHYAAQNTVLAQSTVFGAQPVFGAPQYGQTFIGAPQYGQTFIGAPQYGQTFIGAPQYGQFLPYAGEVQHAEAQENYGNDFTSYSSAGQEVQAQEEPEIRGTQV